MPAFLKRPPPARATLPVPRLRLRPRWGLFDRWSIGLQVFLLAGLLVSAITGWSYRAYVDSAQDLIRNAESEHLMGSAQVALARIEAESRVLSHTARSLARHPAVRAGLGAPSAADDAAALLEMQRSFEGAGLTSLELVDPGQRVHVAFRAPGAVASPAPAWGLAEALAGETQVQTSKEAGGGLMLRALVPVRAARGDAVIGVVVAGTRFDDAFARHIGRDGGLELAIATPLGVVARSSERIDAAPARHRTGIERSLFERRPVLAFDLDRGDLRQYVPLALGDEAFVLIVQGDAQAARARVLAAAGEAVRSSAAMLGAALVLACLFAVHLARRLLRVRRGAEALARDVTGADEPVLLPAGGTPDACGGNELAALERVFAQTSVAVSRHHDTVRQAKEAAEHAANYDALTGLPNRAFLMKELARRLRDDPQAQWALLFLDLDGFKEVNDQLGHDVGDALLSQAAARLTGLAGSREAVARLGGDEFVLIVRSAAALAAPQALAQQVIETLEQPFRIGTEPLIHVSASVGIALHPRHGREAGVLLKRADEAMYRAKSAGKRGFCTYGEERAPRPMPVAASPGTAPARTACVL